SAAPGMSLRNSGANSPNTAETCTPTFSNTRPFIIAMTPPPPGLPVWSVRRQGVRTNRPGGWSASGAPAGSVSSISSKAGVIRSRSVSNQARAEPLRASITFKSMIGHLLQRRRAVIFSHLSHGGRYTELLHTGTRQMTRIPNRPTRRRFLQAAGSAGLGIVAAPFVLHASSTPSWAAGGPFSLGVASGAGRSAGFVLWTRVGADPLSSKPPDAGG